MSYYYLGSGISYVQYLQAKSFVDDISSHVRRVKLEVAHQTREVGADADAIERQGIKVESAVSEGFDRLSFALEDISAGLGELNATFHWGFGRMISQIGHMIDALSELIKIAKTPVQTTAFNHFEIARDAFRQSLYRECLDELNKAIDGDHTSPGYAIEWRFHQMVGTLRLGFADGDLSLIDLPQAEKSFLQAARYAISDYPQDAARAFLSAGWAAYCQGKMADALTHTRQAMTLAPRMGEAVFQEAKVLIASGEIDPSIESLRRAVRIDRRYLLKAQADGDFQQHSQDVLRLIEELRQQARAAAEQAIASAQSAVDVMEEWHVDEGAASERQAALAALTKARENLRTGSYFSCLDARSLVDEFRKKAAEAVAAQKEHMLEIIDGLKDQASALWAGDPEADWWQRGDFAVFEVEQYAPSELLKLKHLIGEVKEAWDFKSREAATYGYYERIQSSLRACVTLGRSAIEKAFEVQKHNELQTLEAQEQAELKTLKTAAIFMLLWPLLVTVGISWGMWHWGERVPRQKFGGGEFLVGTVMATCLWPLVFAYGDEKKKVRERYLEKKTDIRKKYGLRV